MISFHGGYVEYFSPIARIRIEANDEARGLFLLSPVTPVSVSMLPHAVDLLLYTTLPLEGITEDQFGVLMEAAGEVGEFPLRIFTFDESSVSGSVPEQSIVTELVGVEVKEEYEDDEDPDTVILSPHDVLIPGRDFLIVRSTAMFSHAKGRLIQ